VIAFLIAHAATARTLAPFAIAALMIYGLGTLTAGVVRTTTHRHAAFWSPPRLQLTPSGRHSAAHRRRTYAREGARHATPMPALTAPRTAP
jgi:hypothetical protein